MKEVSHKKAYVRDPDTMKFGPLLAIRGENAYEIAVRLGKFTGTEEEWANFIEIERAAAVKSVEDKGAETLESIPDDYTALAEEVARLEADKIDKTSIAQELGDSEEKLLSQKAATEYGKNIEDIIINGEVLVDCEFENGLLNGDTGGLQDSPKAIRTRNFIVAKSVGTITAGTVVGSGVSAYVWEYDENKNFIKREQAPRNGTVSPTSENCAFVKFAFYSSEVAQAEISDYVFVKRVGDNPTMNYLKDSAGFSKESAMTQDATTQEIDDVAKAIVDGKKTINAEWRIGGISVDGDFTYSQQSVITNYIRVQPLGNLVVSATYIGLPLYIAEFDEGFNFIVRNHVFAPDTITIVSENCCYVMVSTNNQITTEIDNVLDTIQYINIEYQFNLTKPYLLHSLGNDDEHAVTQKAVNDGINGLISYENIAEATWENGLINYETGGNQDSPAASRTVEYLFAKDANGNFLTAYSDSVTPYFAEYDENKNFIQRVQGKAGVELTITDENCAYVRVFAYSSFVPQADIPRKVKICYKNEKSIEFLGLRNEEQDRQISSVKNVSDVAISLFRNKKHFSHLFIDKIYGDVNDIIPCQSIHDIAIASRLGFQIVEANCKKVLDSDGNSRYVVMHGASGAIGRQIVLKEYVDNAYGEATKTDTNGTLKFANESLMIAEQTFEDLRENYVYWSKYPKYRTRLTTLEEFLLECKKFGIIPLVQYADDEQIQLMKKYVGNDFILYASNRHGFDGMVSAWAGSNPTVETVLDLCEMIGAPMMVSLSLTKDSTLTDTELKSMVDGVHERGCLIGWASCYTFPPLGNKLLNLGFDFSASASYVNDFESGDIVNAMADISFEEFETTGTVENGILKLAIGDTVTVSGLDTHFLAKGSLQIRYKGTIGLTFGHFINYAHGYTFTSDGTENSWFSTYFMESVPTFVITATEATEVLNINYKASKC